MDESTKAKSWSYTVALVFIVTVVHEVLVIVVVQVEHVSASLLAVAVVVYQGLGDVSFVDSGLEGVEVSLGIGDIVEVDNLAIWFGVADLNTNSAAWCLYSGVFTLWASQ